MLKLLHNIRNLDFSELRKVYSESIDKNTNALGRISAEQAFYDDLALFFSGENRTLGVWVRDGRYLSCVRCERYEDGFLFTCLETAPEERRRGFAYSLLREMVELLKESNQMPVYVHIHNKNFASLALHGRLGFRIVADYARLVDGTVSCSYCTMKYE